MKLTKDEYEYLKQFEDRFITATKSNYSRAIQSTDLKKITDIYSRLIGQTYRNNSNCSTCVLKLLQRLSKYYFEYGTEENSRKAQKDETEYNDVRQGTEEEGNSKKAGKGKK
jgi:hypothetical protein